MGRKKRFKPVITRIKLNPEQAVLACCELGSRGTELYGGNTRQCRAGRCGTLGDAVAT